MTIRTVFANESGNQPASQLDNMYGDVWNAATIPCSVTGTNSLTLTPMTNANQPAAYNQHQRVAFTAGATSTGSVTAALGSLGALNVYVNGGTQAGANDIVSGSYYELAYDSSLNSGGGGWWRAIGTQTPAYMLLNTLTASNSASLADTTSLTSAYSSYDIVLIEVVPATINTLIALQVHSGGAFKSSGYVANAFVFSAAANSNTATTGSIGLTDNSGGDVSNTTGLNGIVTIYAPSGSGGVHKFTGNLSYTTGAGAAKGTLVTGYWNSAATVDGFQVLAGAGNLTSGTIKVYGRR